MVEFSRSWGLSRTEQAEIVDHQPQGMGLTRYQPHRNPVEVGDQRRQYPMRQTHA